MSDCLFCKIVEGKIPAKKVYEDGRTVAFEDINPQAPTHLLIIPKEHIVGLKEATEADAELLGYCQIVAARIARQCPARRSPPGRGASARRARRP